MATAIDFFCGAGGSSSGLAAAGFEVKAAANHWALAIETHNTNHPNTEHFLDDLQQAHPSLYPRADVAWFSPECTNHSIAKGRKRKGIHQLDLWGETGVDPAEEKSRATMREVVEFTEYHKYDVVIVENVVDIKHWQFYDDWWRAMLNLGYEGRVVYANSQFFGVPQSRDRYYAVFWKRGMKAPNLDHRPTATCPKHGQIEAVQAWKRPEFQWGRYGKNGQYLWRCPQCGAEVKPAHTPASAAIDWTIQGEEIGKRTRPLKERTIERIREGIRKFARPVMLPYANGEAPARAVDDAMHTITTWQAIGVAVPPIVIETGGVWDRRAVDINTDSFPTVMTRETMSLIVPPFLTVLKNSATNGYSQPSIGVDEALTTIVASASQHGLVVPPMLVDTTYTHSNKPTRTIDQPMPTQTARQSQALVSPPFLMAYYGNAVMTAVSESLSTITTIERHGLVNPPPVDINSDEFLDACQFRMLTPDELKRGMSFPDEYVILGSNRDQVRQIGNAVTPNVARWLGERVMEVL